MISFGKNSILKCLKNPKRTPKKEEAPRELQYLQPEKNLKFEYKQKILNFQF